MNKKTVTIILIMLFCMCLANLFLILKIISIDSKQIQLIGKNLGLIELLSENQSKMIK